MIGKTNGVKNKNKEIMAKTKLMKMKEQQLKAKQNFMKSFIKLCNAYNQLPDYHLYNLQYVINAIEEQLMCSEKKIK